MHEYSKHQLSSILEIAYLISKSPYPMNILSEDLLKKKIDKAAIALLSTKLPEKQTKELTEKLKTRHINQITTREQVGNPPKDLIIRKAKMEDKIVRIAFILLTDLPPLSVSDIESSVERAATCLGLELKDIDLAALTERLDGSY